MLQRCYNRNCREYPSYGGRGIRVCDRWREANGFVHFLSAVGPQPFPRASLHRKDNDGNYEPANVVWANPRTQSRHRRSNHILTYDGRSMILADWAQRIGMKPVTLGQRLYKGWPVARALSEPVRPRKPYSAWARRNPDPRKPGPKPRRPDPDEGRSPA